MQYVTFVQSLFAFLLALSFQDRLSSSAATFIRCALACKRGRAVGSSVYILVSLFSSYKPCVCEKIYKYYLQSKENVFFSTVVIGISCIPAHSCSVSVQSVLKADVVVCLRACWDAVAILLLTYHMPEHCSRIHQRFVETG